MALSPISDTAKWPKQAIPEVHGINKPGCVDFSVITFWGMAGIINEMSVSGLYRVLGKFRKEFEIINALGCHILTVNSIALSFESLKHAGAP